MTYRNILAVACLILVGSSLFTSTTKAGTTVLTASDVGWYNSNGEHLAFCKGFMVGYAGAFDGLTYRSYYLFDLRNVKGTITSATVRVFSDAYGFDSPNASETLGLFDVSTPASLLQFGQTGAYGVYKDLGTGKLFGTGTVSTANDNKYVYVSLNADGLAALNAARGGTLAFGSSLLNMNTSGNTNELAFTGGYDVSEVQISLTIGTATGPMISKTLVVPKSRPSSR